MEEHYDSYDSNNSLIFYNIDDIIKFASSLMTFFNKRVEEYVKQDLSGLYGLNWRDYATRLMQAKNNIDNIDTTDIINTLDIVSNFAQELSYIFKFIEYVSSFNIIN